MPTKSQHTFVRILIATLASCALVSTILIAYKTDFHTIIKTIAWLLLAPIGWFVYQRNAWRETCVVILTYVVVTGFLIDVPRKPILHEMIRNLYFHVPMWFAMISVLTTSFVFSIRYLRNSRLNDDIAASQLASIGVALGVLGYITGAVWGNYTWDGVPLLEPRLVSAAAALLLYFAYFVLRMSMDDDKAKMRLAAIYNVFSFPTFIVLIYILPRLVENSLHPDLGGNDSFGAYDKEESGDAINDNMKLVFYPAIIGWTLLSFWIASLGIRAKKLFAKHHGLD